jgi:hypothetical protein
VLAVAAKYRMTSVLDFVALESAFTFLQVLVVSPGVALVYRRAHRALPKAAVRA